MSGSGHHEDEQPEAAAPSPAAEPKAGLLAELLEAEPDARVAVAQAPGAELRLGTRIGRLVAWTSRGPTVEFDGNERGPLAARSVIPLTRAEVEAAIASARGVLLTFEDGQPHAPIITGVMQALGDEADPDPAAVGELELDGDPGPPLEARVDGRRVELEAEDELVLRCGKASIVLRRNGRVVIRGTYVETRSRGVNRIKGGSVEIN